MKKVLAMIAVALVAGAANATLLVSYNFFGAGATGPTGPTNGAPFSTQATGIASNNLTRGAGLGMGLSTNRFIATGWNTSDFTLDGAIASNDYFQGFVAATSGNAVNLSNLQYRAIANNANGPTNFVLKISSVNTDAAFLTAWATTTKVLQPVGTGSGLTLSFDLAGNGVTSGTVYYRIYGWRSTTVPSSNASGILGMTSTTVTTDGGLAGYGDGNQDFIIQGTVVPEPATIGMLGLGALCTLLMRRLRRS
ncbi:MAG: PEP-CTERM sorting domain-containing protein [Kiritimatiellaceae bacterium]|nr:PEP-CTERM sorting domain-containing protein [Kiritimatiellaceae bacterium]